MQIKIPPLSIVSYPTKGIRRIRISSFTLSRIDEEVFKDSNYSLYRCNLRLIEIDKQRNEVLSFLGLNSKEGYKDILCIDNGMCSFKTVS